MMRITTTTLRAHRPCTWRQGFVNQIMKPKWTLSAMRRNELRTFGGGSSSWVSANLGPSIRARDYDYDRTRSYTTTTTAKSSLLSDRYRKMVDKGEVHNDHYQLEALKALERLREDLLSYKLPRFKPSASSSSSSSSSSYSNHSSHNDNSSHNGGGFFSSWFGGGGNDNHEATSSSMNLPGSSLLDSFRNPQQPRGVYLHGGCGTGKTMLMNLFYESLTEEPWKSEKQKIHFHKFMAMVHKEMHRARGMVKGQNVSDAVLPMVIDQTAKQGRLICLDEFQVTDVADALILRRLFTGLWEKHGCIVVATSNRAPSDLYLGGLQRDRFLPFIDLLQQYCEEISLWGLAVDYRLIQKVESGQVPSLWFMGNHGREALDHLFYDDLVGLRNPVYPMSLAASADSQRIVKVPQANQERGIARFSFEDLCQQAMGASDYLVIGQNFSTVVVDQIPTLSLNEINWVRRFILLVDAFYESNVKLILHTQQAKQPSDIFAVADKNSAKFDEVFAFDRTVSRLQEMSSRTYLHRKWIGRNNKIESKGSNPGLQFYGDLIQPTLSNEPKSQDPHPPLAAPTQFMEQQRNVA